MFVLSVCPVLDKGYLSYLIFRFYRGTLFLIHEKKNILIDFGMFLKLHYLGYWLFNVRMLISFWNEAGCITDRILSFSNPQFQCIHFFVVSELLQNLCILQIRYQACLCNFCSNS